MMPWNRTMEDRRVSVTAVVAIVMFSVVKTPTDWQLYPLYAGNSYWTRMTSKIFAQKLLSLSMDEVETNDDFFL